MMLTAPAEMLRKLGSGVRPTGSAPGGAFSGVWRGAAAVRGRDVRVAPKLLTDIMLSEERLRQISAATDAAEAAGALTLLVMDRDGAYVVDIGSRMIDRERQEKRAPSSPEDAARADEHAQQTPVVPTGLLVGVDAVAVLPTDEHAAVDKTFAARDGLIDGVGTPNAGERLSMTIGNESLARLLAACMSGSAR